MVAVVSGAGLGLFHSNLNSGVGGFGNAEQGLAKERIHVNAATGNLVVQYDDEKITALGAGFSLLRTYNSQSNDDGDNNDQWRLGYISTVSIIDATRYQRTTADGFVQTFVRQGISNEFLSFEGRGHADKLIVHNDKITISSDGGVTETYDASNGVLLERTDPLGKMEIRYAGSKPTKIIQTLQSGIDETLIEYYPTGHASEGLIKSMRTSNLNGNQNLVTYQYDSARRLQKVSIDKSPDVTTDQMQHVIEYEYNNSTSLLLWKIKQYAINSSGSVASAAQTSVTTITYDASNRVKTVDAGGRKSLYEYNGDITTVKSGEYTAPGSVLKYTDIVDYKVNTQKQVISVAYKKDGIAVSEVFYDYYATGQLKSSVDGLGVITSFTYDSKGNQDSVTVQGQTPVTRGYNAQNQLIIEAQGSYVKRYVYDTSGYFLRFEIAADGSVTEHRYNALKQREQTRQYTKASYNLQSTAVNASLSLTELENWLERLTDKSAQLLTTFKYDVRGNLENKTQYTQADALGNGIGEGSVWGYIYDFRGNLLTETLPEGAKTPGNPNDYAHSYTYDGLGRLLSYRDAENNIATISYIDIYSQINIVYANGRSESHFYDKSGAVNNIRFKVGVNLPYGANVSTVYDSDGRTIAVKDRFDAWEYSFYESGALAATVDKNGAITRYFYNNAGQLERTEKYGNFTLQQGDISASTNRLNRTVEWLDTKINASTTKTVGANWSFYENGLKKYDIDAGKFVTEYKYDSNGRLSRRVIYRDPVDAALIANKLAGFNSSVAVASYEQLSYDKAGRLETITNAEEFRTQFFYDKAGQKIAETQYINTVSNDQVVPHAGDRTTHWRYDAQGRTIATVSADGLVTAFSYDLNGQLLNRTEYAQVVRNLGIGQVLQFPAGTRREFTYSYNGNGQLISETGPDGLSVLYKYNKTGQVIEKTQGKLQTATSIDSTKAYVQERFEYDEFGRLTAVLDANANKSDATLGLNATALAVQNAFKNNASSRFIYDFMGNLLEKQDANKDRTLYYYNAAGQRVAELDPMGQLVWYQYNEAGELTDEFIAEVPLDLQLNASEGKSWLTYLSDNHLTWKYAERLAELEKAKSLSADFTHKKLGYSLKGELQSYSRDLTSNNGAVSQKWNAIGVLKQVSYLQTYVNSANNWNMTTEAMLLDYSYDKRGLLDTEKRAGQLVADYDYDAFGRLVKKTDALGNMVVTSYTLDAVGASNDKIGRVISTSVVVNGAERKTILRYDAFDRVLEAEDSLGNVTRYSYDDVLRTMAVTNVATGVSTVSTRNLLGRVTEVEVRQGSTSLQKTSFVYDANGNLTDTYLNGSLQEKRSYNKNNALEFITDANGSRVQTFYDKSGKVIKTVSDVDGLALTTEWQQTGSRSVVKQVSGDRVNWTTFDKNGRVQHLDQLEVVDGVRYQVRTSYSYDQAGQKISVAVGSRQQIDALDKPITGTEDLSAVQTTKYEYDILGRLIRQYQQNGSEKAAEMRFSYDAADQLIEKQEVLSANELKRTFYGYNEAGELVYQLQSHSEIGNKLQLSLQTFEYDRNGRRIASHQYQSLLNSGVSKNADLSPSNVKTLVNNATGTKASSFTAYDSEGRVVAQINPAGTRSFVRYDGLGRVIEEFTSGLSGLPNSAELSQLRAGTFGHGAGIYSGTGDMRTSYIYNGLNKVAYKLVATGTQAMVAGYRYDTEGKLIAVRQYQTLTTYLATPKLADVTGLQTTLQDRVTQQFYDSADRLRYAIDATGMVTEYNYNVHGQVISETKHADLVSKTPLLKQGWDAGTLTFAELQSAYPGSVLATGSRRIVTEYDSLGRVAKVIYPEKNNNGESYTESYQYNAAGLKTYVTDKNGKVWHYQYDAAGRLKAEYTPHITAQDKVQVQLSNGQYVSYNGYGKKSYTYDAQGNVLSLTEGVVRLVTDNEFYTDVVQGVTVTAHTRTTSFVYDNAGRQVKIVQPTAQNAPAVYTETTYDALGRAISSVVYSDGQIEKTQFKAYDAAGRLRYDILSIDSNLVDIAQATQGYVTAYEYNSFGQQIKLTRYGNAVAIGAVVQALLEKQPAGQSSIQLQELLLNNGWDLAGARVVDTIYDAAGRKTRVLEQARDFSYWDNGQLKTNHARPESTFEYNSFGEVWKTSVKVAESVNGSQWLDSYSWYDLAGRQTHQRDAAGYLSTWTYNSFGSVASYTEFARATPTQSWQKDQPPALPAAADQTTGADRSWQYQYDLLGRKITETQFGMSYYQNAQSNTVSGSLVKTTKYDGLGQVVRTTDASGATVLDYNALGQLIKTQAPSVDVITNVKNLNPNLALSQQQTSIERQSQFSYDIFGNMVLSRQLAGVVADDSKDKLSYFKYNARDQAVEQIDVLDASQQKVTTFNYNASGQLQQQTSHVQELAVSQPIVVGYQALEVDVPGNSLRAGMSVENWLNFDAATGFVTGVAPLNQVYGSIQLTLLDKFGLTRTYQVTDLNGSQSILASVNQPLKLKLQDYIVADATPINRQFITSYLYDAQGNQRQLQVQSSGLESPAVLKTDYLQVNQYNAFGESVSQSRLNSADVLELQQRAVYNSSGQLSKSDENQGAITKLHYDLAGRLLEIQHALTGSQQFVLDAAGRQQTIRSQGMNVGQFYETNQQFDRWGNVTELTDVRGFVYSYQYNHLNKVIAEYKPEATAVHVDGSVERQQAASFYRFDSRGQLLVETDANGGRKQYQYDNAGNLTVTTDAEGNRTYYGYDLFGRQVAQQDAGGLIQTTEYNQFGLATETGRVFKASAGSAQWFEYEKTNEFQYNNAGQRISSKDAMGNVMHYRYNAREQLIMSLSPSGLQKKYTYNALGIKTQEQSKLLGSGAVLQSGWSTSVDGIVQSQTDLGGVVTNYQFVTVNGLAADGSEAGSVSSHLVQSIEINNAGERNRKVRYEYYANGWLKSVTDVLSGTSSAYIYNENGQRISETHVAKDLTGGSFTQVVATQYDELGRVRKIEVADQNGKLMSKISYRYDAVGNRRSLSIANGLEGEIQAVSAVPQIPTLLLPLKADSVFISKTLNFSQLFDTDELNKLTLQLAAPVPDWLKLEYADDGSFYFTNQPGKKSPVLSATPLQISLKAVERETGREMAATRLTFNLVVSSDLELNNDALKDVNLRWKQIANGAVEPLSFATSFVDKDGDPVTISPPSFFANNIPLTAQQISDFFSWDAKKAELSLKTDLAQLEALYPELDLTVVVKGSSVGVNGITEQSKVLHISIIRNNIPVIKTELSPTTPGIFLEDNTLLHGVVAGAGALNNKLSLGISQYFTDLDNDVLSLVKVEGLPSFLLMVQSTDGSDSIQNWPGDQNQATSYRNLVPGTYELIATVTDGYDEAQLKIKLVINPAGTVAPNALANWPAEVSIGEGQTSTLNLNPTQAAHLRYRLGEKGQAPKGLQLNKDGSITGVVAFDAVQAKVDANGKMLSNGWDKTLPEFEVKAIDLNTGLASLSTPLPLIVRNTPTPYSDGPFNLPQLKLLTGFSEFTGDRLKIADIPSSFITTKEGRIVTSAPNSNLSSVVIDTQSSVAGFDPSKFELLWDPVTHTGQLFVKRAAGPTWPTSVQLRVIDGGVDGHGSHVIEVPIIHLQTPVKVELKPTKPHTTVNLTDNTGQLTLAQYGSGYAGFVDKRPDNGKDDVSYAISFNLAGKDYAFPTANPDALRPLKFDAETGLLTGFDGLSTAVKQTLNGQLQNFQFEMRYRYQGVLYTAKPAELLQAQFKYVVPSEYVVGLPTGPISEGDTVQIKVSYKGGTPPFSKPSIRGGNISPADFNVVADGANAFNINLTVNKNMVAGTGSFFNIGMVELTLYGSNDNEGLPVKELSIPLAITNKPDPWTPPALHLSKNVNWTNVSAQELEIGTIGSWYITTGEGRLVTTTVGGNISDVKLAAPAPEGIRLDWNPVTHTGRVMLMWNHPSPLPTTLKVVVTDTIYGKPTGTIGLDINSYRPPVVGIGKKTFSEGDIVNIDFTHKDHLTNLSGVPISFDKVTVKKLNPDFGNDDPIQWHDSVIDGVSFKSPHFYAGTASYASEGTYSVKLFYTVNGVQSSTSFDVVIAPKAKPIKQLDNPIPTLVLKEGIPTNYWIPQHFDLAEQAPVTFTFAPPVPTWLKVNSNGFIEASPDYTHSGLYKVNFTVKGKDGVVHSSFINIDVKDRNAPPEIKKPMPDVTKTEGDTLNIPLFDYFLDKNYEPLNYVVTFYEDTVDDFPTAPFLVDAATLGSNISVNSGVLTGTLNHTSHGKYKVKVVAYDGKDYSAPIVFKLTINDSPVPNTKPTRDSGVLPQQNATQYSLFGGFNVAYNFHDTDTLSYSLAGSYPDGIYIHHSTGEIYGTPNVPNYYTFTVIATDTVGQTVSAQISMNVAPAAVVNLPPDIKYGHPHFGGSTAVKRDYGYLDSTLRPDGTRDESESNRLYYLSGYPSKDIFVMNGKNYIRTLSINVSTYFNDPEGQALFIDGYDKDYNFLKFSGDRITIELKNGLEKIPSGTKTVTVMVSDGKNRVPLKINIVIYQEPIESNDGFEPVLDSYDSRGLLDNSVASFSSEMLGSGAALLNDDLLVQTAMQPATAVSVTDAIQSEPQQPTPKYAKNQTYWYAYDKNNRVVIDGGSINAETGIIDIHQQGRWINYNAVGQQAYIITANQYVGADDVPYAKQSGQKLIYNGKNQLASVYQSAVGYEGSWLASGSFIKFNEVYQPLLNGTIVKSLSNHIDWRQQQAFSYDAADRLQTTYSYSNTVATRKIDLANEDVDFTVQFDMRGTLMSMQQTVYNADGQVQKVTTNQLLVDMADAKLFNLVQQRITTSGLAVSDGTVLNGQGLLELSAADLTTTGSVTEYQNLNAAGLAERTVTRVTKPDDNNPGRTTVDELSWSRSYEKRDSLLESKVSGTAQSGSKGGQFKDASSYSQYDAHGNKVLVVEGNELQDSKFKVRQMLYAADGSLLRMQHSEVAKSGVADALVQVTNHLNQVRSGQAVAGRVQLESIHISSNGDYLGDISVDRGETLPEEHWLYRTSIKDQHFNSGVERTDTQKHTVRSGDTLQSLAQLYYGNADYWYLIATANGLSQSSSQGGPDSQLIEGTTLDIPQRANSFNTHNSFKPMDLQQIIGDTTPNVPYLPPPPAAGCNALAMVVIIAVVVIVTAATQGAMTKDALTWGAKAMAYATAAAAGDVAGQATAIALNQQDGFNAGQTFRAAGTAFVTVGVSHGLGQTAPASGEGFWASRVGDVAQLSHTGRAAVAASGVLSGMAINRLTTGHSGFSWRQVASSAVMVAVGGRLPLEGTGNIALDTLSGIAQSGIQYGIAKALGDNKVSWNFRDVARDAFGNAIGNSIVSNRINAEQTKRNAMLASDALSQQTNGRLNQQLDAELQQSAGVIANDVGTRSAAAGASGFDANVLAQLNATDLMQNQYLDKRAGAIDGYLNMSQKTQRDIQSIDARTETSRQQRATQAAQIQQRYDQRTMDFRMANPIYRGSAPLFDYDSALAADNAMWGAGKQRAQGFRDGIASGVDLLERSANAYGRAFEKTYDRFNQIMNKGFDSFIDQPADGVRTITDAYSLSGGYSTFTFGGEVIFAFQSDGKVAVGLAGAPAGFKMDTGRGLESGVTRLHWQPGVKPADAESILGGWGTTGGLMVNTPIGSVGRVESVSWVEKPFSSSKAAVATGWSYSTSLVPKVESVIQAPVTPVANVSSGIQVPHTSTIDLGWFGKLLYWGRQ